MENMHIRPFRQSDINTLVRIWLEGSRIAHHFINPIYWETRQNQMAEQYLPQSETFVLEEVKAKRIAGFISLIDDYIAALFVDPDDQGKGLGKLLLD